MIRSPAERFAAKVILQGECLVWVGARSRNGYGQIGVRGKVVYAHRFAWEQAHGPIPEGLVIDHRCHNKACVNVAHLRTVTRKQNNENQAGLPKNNNSGYLGVSWHKSSQNWRVRVDSDYRARSGGYYPLYELHVAGHKARLLRDKYHTHNDLDRA